jgi:hypothetical protein
MALKPIDIVTMLDRDDALAPADESPWPTHEGDVRPVDWSGLFPERGRGGLEAIDADEVDPFEPDLDEEFLGELAERAGTGQSSNPSREGFTTQPDVCAWYQPLHFHGLDWGIFVKEDCMLRLALEIAAFVPHRPRSQRELYILAKATIRSAFASLFLHEHYHHKTESFGLRVHVVEQVPRYTHYFRAIYKPLLAAGSDDLHEEGLANADSFRRLPTQPYLGWLGRMIVDATQTYLRFRFPYDPPGYRRAADLIWDPDFIYYQDLLMSQMGEGVQVPVRDTADWLIAPRINQSFFSCRSDVWTIVQPGGRRVLPAGLPYPSVSTDALIKGLRHLGYERKSGGKGSHVKLAADGRPILILPGNRKDLSPVVLRNTAKALGYRNPQDLVESLGV